VFSENNDKNISNKLVTER